MLTIIKAGDQEVTGTLAEEWLKETVFEGQRKLNSLHVQFLGREMAGGRFRPKTPIEFGVLDGKYYLVNGQHTLNAVKNTGVTLLVNVTLQEVSSMKELGTLYVTHDINKKRTLAEAYAAQGLNKQYRMQDSEVNAFGRCAPYIAGNFGFKAMRESPVNQSRELRRELMDKYHEAARAYLDCLKGAEPPIRKSLLFGPVMALATYTMAHAPDEATRFWTLAANDENLTKTDPPKVVTMLVQRQTRTSAKSQVALVQTLARVWNAFIQGRQLKRIPTVSTPAEEVIIMRTPLSTGSQLVLPSEPDDNDIDTVSDMLVSDFPPPADVVNDGTALTH